MTDPASILAGIPGFAGAALAAQLSDGPTNASYRVERGAERFVLRIDKPEAARLGLDRDAEREIGAALAAAGLAEATLYRDAEGGVTLRRFVPGRPWSRRDVRRPQSLRRLAALFRELHALPPSGRPFEPLRAAARYARQVGTARARALYTAAADAFARIVPAEPALCHNDAVCDNIIAGARGPVLIDWEYAGTGDPFFDLAVVVQHHGVPQPAAIAFLEAYLGRAHAARDLDRLERQCRFYRALLELWRLRTGTGAEA